MSEAIEQSLLRRLRHTPLRDLLRGRVSGRLDIRKQIDATPLPLPVRQMIFRIVQRTRLWRREKLDVATELIAHFMDGIEAGVSPEQLVESFGNEKAAVKLIRRSKKRNRGLLWQTARMAGCFFLATTGLYLLIAIFYFSSSPSIKIDYVGVINQPIEKTSDVDRGWPIYRSVLLAIDPDRRLVDFPPDHWRNFCDARPGSTRWPIMVRWLEANPTVVTQLRQAAGKPQLGFIYGPQGSITDTQLFPNLANRPHTESLPEMLLPELNELRLLSLIVEADSALAIERHDVPRATMDIEALLGMAEQTRRPFLINDLVALKMRVMAVRQLQALLLDSGQTMQESQLQQIAHRLAGPQYASDLIDLGGERTIFADIMQRMFTDDGHGNGRITPQGLAYLKLMSNSMADVPEPMEQQALRVAAGPGLLLAMAPREEIVSQYNRLFGQADSAIHRAWHEVKWDTIYDVEVQQWNKSPLMRIRYLPLVVLMPSIINAHASGERYLGQRDGLLCAIALEIYHRREGKYPLSLSELSPRLLPSVPVDRMTGQPVLYRLVDGKPIIYSAGEDQDDDHGVPYSKGGDVMNEAAGPGNSNNLNAPDGDWILFPQPVEPPTE